MKKLLKEYGFRSDMQYYEMIVESVINGQINQAKLQFLALSKENRKAFVKAALWGWKSGLSRQSIEMFFDLI